MNPISGNNNLWIRKWTTTITDTFAELTANTDKIQFAEVLDNENDCQQC